MTACILIIDDNPVNLKLACRLLEMEGYKIDLATDAEQAQDLLLHMTPDLILTDIALPGIDGLTFIRRLKTEARFRRVPIVAMTAFAMSGDDLKAFDAGCDGYITKPIDTRKFPQQITEFLRKAQEDKPAP